MNFSTEKTEELETSHINSNQRHLELSSPSYDSKCVGLIENEKNHLSRVFNFGSSIHNKGIIIKGL